MITGKVIKDNLTKKLIHRISPGEIALIAHRDLDEIMARCLLEAGVKAVINTEPFISGKFPHRGPQVLREQGVQLLRTDSKLWAELTEGDRVDIFEGAVYLNNRFIGQCISVDVSLHKKKRQQAAQNFNLQLESFIDNTLENALQDKPSILQGDFLLPDYNFRDRDVLVVVRGRNYKKDLAVISDHIEEWQPAIIAVDGGADGCLEAGIIPDFIIGDMDSVSDSSLYCGARIIVHGYRDGRAPGLQRINDLGLEAGLITVPGTSEDAALLFAYEKGAAAIVALGTHLGAIDFLEKGRAGMGSTILIRMKIGHKLIDLRGISQVMAEEGNFSNNRTEVDCCE